MSSRHFSLPISTVLALAAALAAAGAADAGVISATPTLPPLGAPFGFTSAGSCFPTAGACAEPGTLTFTSVVPSPPAPPGFNPAGQDIVANATLTGELTTLSHVPIAPLLLTGTVEMEIEGRTFSTETGSWTIALLNLDLEGPALGHTLTLQLDGSTPSTGTASIVPIDDTGQFLINSFFDVFVDLSLDTPTPLHAVREAQLQLANVPEPSGLALLAAGAGILVIATFRKRTYALLTATSRYLHARPGEAQHET